MKNARKTKGGGKRSRRKGRGYEYTVRDMMREVFAPMLQPEAIQRGRQNHAAQKPPDVTGVPWLWIEAKRWRKCNWRAALRQAVADAAEDGSGLHPVAICQDDQGKRGVRARDPAVVIMQLPTFLWLLRLLVDHLPAE